ncbi:MAG TPA: winged helix-turn-helix domain-containing protein [Actinomycetales bacterium]|nr:winged helix-turn-helix domain-containing protein [Actinomycetales bacterium]
MTPKLTLSQARRMALRAQGLEAPPRAPATKRTVTRAATGIGVIQIDSVNVLARAHYMPLYARLGPYPREHLDSLYSARPHRLLEQWGHEACLVTPEVHRLLAPLRKGWAERYLGNIEEEHPGVMDAVHQVVAAHGPLTAREVQHHLEEDFPAPAREPGQHGWWSWTACKKAIEFAFHGGTIASAGRNARFERRYDLVERILPAEHLHTPTREEAYAELTRRSLAHLGLGTAAAIADYYRLRVEPVTEELTRLEAEGEAELLEVEGIKAPVWKDPAATIPRRATATTLLSPFDPLIFERRRTEELFGMRYRIGIYTPAAKRTHGYYSLPLLVGETLPARYDLKADRTTSRLIVNGAFLEEPGAARWPSRAEVAAVAVGEFRKLAGWLGLEGVVVGEGANGEGIGDVAHALG